MISEICSAGHITKVIRLSLSMGLEKKAEKAENKRGNN